MALKGTLIWICSLADTVCLCLLAVLSLSATQHETSPHNKQPQLFERLNADLKVAVESGENLPATLTAQQSAALLLLVRNLADSLHKHQLKDCQGSEPKNCTEAEVPKNGGLACVTVANKRYCKPMCNYGYDFNFLRRSRLFEECSEQTGHKWVTQYVGGNKLAMCNEASSQISGAKSAYFPKDQDCLTTKSNSDLQNSTLEILTRELQSQGIQGDPQYHCLVCG
ncbi:uncharacterized protein si:ch1073-126c3.2 isoform X2 [Lates calcarifer]|uniref:Uncharacterized protein si:ch1073-126c3.2 isoform X2 n=1 Tax=Lates calcarifer TaxID=8187 RepID=A0AAJ7LA58_LATCA|nr:uncharacterized protein si:ch1073-126c3.2 isoform X2 [Lates calcarifer]